MYYGRNRTIVCRLFLWVLLFAVFCLVPELQAAEESVKERLIAPDMGSWINSIATFAVSLGVLFLLLVFAVLVIMFWGVVSSIKSIINAFAEKEQEDTSILQKKLRCRASTKKTQSPTIKNIEDKLNEIRKDLDAMRTQGATISSITERLRLIRETAGTLDVYSQARQKLDIDSLTTQI